MTPEEFKSKLNGLTSLWILTQNNDTKIYVQLIKYRKDDYYPNQKIDDDDEFEVIWGGFWPNLDMISKTKFNKSDFKSMRMADPDETAKIIEFVDNL